MLCFVVDLHLCSLPLHLCSLPLHLCSLPFVVDLHLCSLPFLRSDVDREFDNLSRAVNNRDRPQADEALKYVCDKTSSASTSHTHAHTHTHMQLSVFFPLVLANTCFLDSDKNKSSSMSLTYILLTCFKLIYITHFAFFRLFAGTLATASTRSVRWAPCSRSKCPIPNRSVSCSTPSISSSACPRSWCVKKKNNCPNAHAHKHTHTHTQAEQMPDPEQKCGCSTPSISSSEQSVRTCA